MDINLLVSLDTQNLKYLIVLYFFRLSYLVFFYWIFMFYSTNIKIFYCVPSFQLSCSVFYFLKCFARFHRSFFFFLRKWFPLIDGYNVLWRVCLGKGKLISNQGIMEMMIFPQWLIVNSKKLTPSLNNPHFFFGPIYLQHPKPGPYHSQNSSARFHLPCWKCAGSQLHAVR